MSSQKKILVLDANDSVVDVIEYAKQRGYYVITCDNNPLNVGHQYANENLFISVYDIEQLKRSLQNEKIDAVVYFTSEHGLYAASQLKDFLGIKGISADVYQKISNKGEFRKLLTKNHINCPRYQIVNKFEMINVREIIYPVIVKPVDGMGGNLGVTKVLSYNELEVAVRRALDNSRSKYAIIEEFIESDLQVNGDCVVSKGILWGSFLGKHVYENSESIIPYATIFSEELINDTLKKKINDEINKVIKAANIYTGILNVELRIKPNGEIYFVEINPRHSGNRIYQLMSKCSGISMSDFAIELALDEADVTKLNLNMGEKSYAYGILFSKESGRLKKLKLSDELERYVIDKKIFKEIGNKVSAFKGLRDRLGLLLLEFPTKEIMMEIMLKLGDYYDVEVE